MKYRKTAAFSAAIVLMLSFSSCGKTAVNNPDSEQNNKEVTESISAPSEETADPFTRIEIETVNRGSNVMDFVTKPVNRFVAEAKLTWTPGYVIPPAPYYEECTVTVKDAEGNVMLDSAGAEVKVRGNWTSDYDKKPLRIKFAEKQNMLGLNDGNEMRNWVLLAEYKDGSMLRNKTAFQISGEILGEDGLYSSDADFAEVYINGEYWGLYLTAEQQQTGKNRINITEPEEGYTGTDIGYFMEFDGYYSNEDELQQFFADYNDNAPVPSFNGGKEEVKMIKCLPDPKKADDPVKEVGITIKSDIYSKEQHDFIASFVNNVYRIMYSAAVDNKAFVFSEDFTEITEAEDVTPQEAVERVVDVNSLADMYIISELTCDADIYWSSFYMDADFGPEGSRKLRFEAPWDFDSSMGNKDRCGDGTGFYAASIVPDVNMNEYETINPWLAVIMGMDWYQDIIREKWTKAYDGGVFTRAFEMIDNDCEKWNDAFIKNNSRWEGTLGVRTDFAAELTHEARTAKTQKEAADYMKSWLSKRVDFLNGYWHK